MDAAGRLRQDARYADLIRRISSCSAPAVMGFLALWKDADSDIPILKQAKAEYAKLQ